MHSMGAGDQTVRLVLGLEAEAGAVLIRAVAAWHDALRRRPGALAMGDAEEQLAASWVAVGAVCGALEADEAEAAP